eukprot:ANDGO_05253.mRNA.1 putative DNA helicase MCM8
MIPLAEFSSRLCEEPEKMLTCLGISIYMTYYIQLGDLWFDTFPKVNARIHNLPQLMPLRNIRTAIVGRLVALKGTVVRTSVVKPVIVSVQYVCEKCSAKQRFWFPDGKCVLPKKCSTPRCKSRAFSPERSSALTEDWQKLRIQEIMDDDQTEAGRIPRSIECELRGDLVDSCVPGDQVTVCGIVKAILAQHEGKSNRSVYQLYIDAVSVVNQKSSSQQHQSSSSGSAIDQFSPQDLAAIRELQRQPDLFRILVHSLCPTIYGHDIVKAGLVLTLFGACRSSEDQDPRKMSVRGDPHLLIVGDPGLGKSNLLKAATQVSPRSVYVCGNTATTTGLTVTVVKDSITGDFSLEAGALVLADQGICCIDEFDKMACEHSALLEAMEQQSISIAKAGMCCSLPSRCSVIAAANPTGGHYNRSKTVAENIKLPSPLLSRFDLIFILLDRPDENHDRLLSEHVMRIHGAKMVRTSVHPSSTRNGPTFRQTQALADVMSLTSSSMNSVPDFSSISSASLAESLRLRPHESINRLSQISFRKLLTYARKFVHPMLSPEASCILQTFYLSLRKKQTADGAPITTRQLEALVRLAKARARAELRDVVTEEDASDVILVMRDSFYDTVVDEFGNIDFERPSRGGSSKAKDVTRVVAALNRESQRKNSSVFHISEIKDLVVNRLRVQSLTFEDFMDYLNMNNYVLKKGNGMYKLQTSAD